MTPWRNRSNASAASIPAPASDKGAAAGLMAIAGRDLIDGMKIAAGCLVRARFRDGSRFLLVHPSGSYNRRAPWSIPKGELEPGESPEECAIRETREETGIACRILSALGDMTYKKSHKRIIAFLAEPDAALPGPVLEPASWEVDRVEFLSEDEARQRIHPDQLVFIERAAQDPPAPPA
jgi:8-oxo-dGTP pyrophosphatase MutT (NUDIX family)